MQIIAADFERINMYTIMKGRALAIMISLAVALSMMPVVAGTAYASDEITIGGIRYELNGDNTATVTRQESSVSGDVLIPEKISYGGNKYSVTSIGEEAFNSCAGLNSIVLPKSVTSIGTYAFYGSGVTAVTFHDTMMSIGENAFDYFGELKTVSYLCGTDEQFADLIAGKNTGIAVWVEIKMHLFPLAEHKEVPATCTSSGNIAYWTCENCNTIFFEAGGEHEIKDPVILAHDHRYGPWKQLDAAQHQRVCDYNESHVERENHIWDSGKVTKPGTEKNNGEKIYTCTICGSVKKETMPIIIAKMTAKGKKGLAISWSRIQGAKGYDIFFAGCKYEKKRNDCKNLKDVKGNNILSWTKTGLKKNKAYKAYVKAYVYENGKKKYITESPLVHAYTSGGNKKFTNAKSVTVKKTKVTLKKGKTYRIKANVRKLKKKKKLMSANHAPKLRYMTSDAKVATVSRNGMITAKSKGACYVYAYAHNGVSKIIKVTVK